MKKIKFPPQIENTTPPNSLHLTLEDMKTNYASSLAKISSPCFKIVALRWTRLRAKELDGEEERIKAATKV